MNRLQLAEQFRKALQMFAESLDESRALEVSTIYDAWEPGKQYAKDAYCTYGTNGVGDPQLYRVAQAHTSSDEWKPGGAGTEALYTPIGLDDSGYPLWSQPTGAHDAYNTGDVVDYNGTLYRSEIDGNITVPGTDDRWWTVYTEDVV